MRRAWGAGGCTASPTRVGTQGCTGTRRRPRGRGRAVRDAAGAVSPSCQGIAYNQSSPHCPGRLSVGSIDKQSYRVCIVYANRGTYREDVTGRFLEATLNSWLFGDRPFIRAKHFTSVDFVQQFGDNTMGHHVGTLVTSAISFLTSN